MKYSPSTDNKADGLTKFPVTDSLRYFMSDVSGISPDELFTHLGGLLRNS